MCKGSVYICVQIYEHICAKSVQICVKKLCTYFFKKNCVHICVKSVENLCTNSYTNSCKKFIYKFMYISVLEVRDRICVKIV